MSRAFDAKEFEMRKVIVIMILAASLVTPTVAQAQESDFTVQPGPGSATSERGDYFVVPMQPGGSSRQTVALRNDSSSPIEVRLAAVDARTGPIGGVSYDLVGESLQRVGAWISLEDDSVTIPPGGQTVVGFSIAVPTEVAPGQHVGGLAIWRPEDESPEPSQTGTGASIIVKTRRVLAVQVELPGGIGPHLTITNVEPAARPDGLYLEIAIDHDGHKLTRGNGFIELASDSFRRDFLLDTFVPGTSIRYPIKWAEAAKTGRFRGHVEIHYDGLVAVWDGDVEMNQQVQEELEERLVNPEAESSSGGVLAGLPVWAVPAALGFWVLAVPIFFFLFFWRRKKKEEKSEPEEGTAPEPVRQEGSGRKKQTSQRR